MLFPRLLTRRWLLPAATLLITTLCFTQKISVIRRLLSPCTILISALRESLFNSDLFSDVFYILKIQASFSPRAETFNAEDFFTRYRVFEDYPEDFFDELMKKDYKNTLCPPTNIRTCTTTGQFSDYGRCLPFAVNLSGYRASDAVLVLLVKESLLNQTLGRLNNDQTSYLYLLDTQSRTILNQPAEEDYASILALSAFDWNASEGETICKADDTYRIYWKKSPVHKLLYLDVEPGLLITRQLHSFLGADACCHADSHPSGVLLHFYPLPPDKGNRILHPETASSGGYSFRSCRYKPRKHRFSGSARSGGASLRTSGK